ncbi:MAG: sulfurtransferase TusA family protein [Alcanivoracaceae bacterium]|nr:sulfurtransferase TusA family protein [Alcanivoracaceae bacterium]
MSNFPSATLDANLELDVRQLACPMPLLKARQAMRQLADGELLHVIASDPGARRDIPAWVGQSGHELVHQGEEQGVLHFWIRCREEKQG